MLSARRALSIASATPGRSAILETNGLLWLGPWPHGRHQKTQQGQFAGGMPPAAELQSERGPEALLSAEPAPARLSNHGYFLLILICAVGDASYMTLAPFFPQRAAEVGLSGTVIGLTFSCFMWGGLVVTPVATWLSRTTSSRVLLSTCVLLQAVFTALFALAPLLERGWQWFLLTFSLRLVQGVIAAIYEVAVSSIIMRSVPVEHVGSALGVQEAARGVGMMIGPAVGGVLYAAGGFALPFLASAGVLALLGVAVLLWVGDDEAIGDEDDIEHATFAQVRRIRRRSRSRPLPSCTPSPPDTLHPANLSTRQPPLRCSRCPRSALSPRSSSRSQWLCRCSTR